jgi:hypothetical protein
MVFRVIVVPHAARRVPGAPRRCMHGALHRVHGNLLVLLCIVGGRASLVMGVARALPGWEGGANSAIHHPMAPRRLAHGGSR